MLPPMTPDGILQNLVKAPSIIKNLKRTGYLDDAGTDKHTLYETDVL